MVAHSRSAGSLRRSALIAAAALSAAVSTTPASAQSLSLAEALRLAARDAPVLTAQDAAIRAAREASLGAAELPDPKLIVGVDNLPAEGGDRFSFTRDFMTMRKVGVMQDFPREEKRELRGARAAAEVRRETAIREATAANLQRDVALAWIEAWIAERQLAILAELEGEAEVAAAAAPAAVAGGRGPLTEPIAARQARSQVADRLTEARRVLERSRAQLGRWIGAAADRPLGEAPDFTRIPRDTRRELLDLEAHPHLAMYLPMEEMAQAEVKLAQAAKQPDWSLEVTYQQRGSAYSNMVSINARIDLPIFEARRQDPAIASKVAALEQVRAQAEEARRAYRTEVRLWLVDWDAAVERARRVEGEQIPLAAERREAALASYRGGRGELAAALEARRNHIETRLAHLAAVAEAARAWAQLNFSLLAQGSQEAK